MNYTIREAIPGDLDVLVSFTVSGAREAEGIQKEPERVNKGIRVALEDDSVAKYWVLENNHSEIIASISVVKEWSDWNAGYYWWIQSLFITPGYRGKGLLETLLDMVKDAARAGNALDLRLYVHQSNTRAIKAYHKTGFADSPYKIMTMEL